MVKYSQFWQNWWDDKATHDLSNYELDRGTNLRDDKLNSILDTIYDYCDPKSHECILDAGCGTGINISRFGPDVREIVGVDISNEMLRRAKTRIKNENLENSEVIISTINRLGFKNDQFDKIICNSALQYLNDNEYEAALAEFIRVSKENSVIILHIKNKLSIYGLTLCFTKFIARMLRHDVIPEHYRSHSYYKNIMECQGAQLVDLRSNGLFQVFFFPKMLRIFLYRIEMRFKDNWFLKYMGVDCLMKFSVARRR